MNLTRLGVIYVVHLAVFVACISARQVAIVRYQHIGGKYKLKTGKEKISEKNCLCTFGEHNV